MATDIRRMSKEELDDLNRQIAIYRKSRPTETQSEKQAEFTPTEQLQLFNAEDTPK
jgi:hypothetical protein